VRFGGAPGSAEDICDVLTDVWRAVCGVYEVSAELPDLQTLFEATDLSVPDRAAETVLAHMLSEAVECVGRFSPWYRQPAGAFGLVLVEDESTHCLRWTLSPEGARLWRDWLRLLMVAIKKNTGLILSANLTDGLDEAPCPDDPCVMAACLCVPARVIRVRRAILASTEIVCEVCHKPFRPLDDAPDADG
jgi:hypothetical protein